jgi:hypothetical protein
MLLVSGSFIYTTIDDDQDEDEAYIYVYDVMSGEEVSFRV